VTFSGSMRKGLTRPRLFLMAAVPALLQALPALAADETCFEGARECRTFWITEVGLTPRLNEAPNPNKASFYFHWDVGHMANFGNWAAGGTVFVGTDDYGSRYGVKGRLRRWLGPRISIDVSPGLVLGGSDRYGMKFPGFTGHMALNLREWVQATAMVEVLTLDPDPLRYPEIPPQTDTAWYAGITSGSYGGLIGSVVLGVAAVIAVASLQGF
jgi:hypothetical protein